MRIPGTILSAVVVLLGCGLLRLTAYAAHPSAKPSSRNEYAVPYAARINPAEAAETLFYFRDATGELIVSSAKQYFHECLGNQKGTDICVALRGSGAYKKALVDELLDRTVFSNSKYRNKDMVIGSIEFTCELNKLSGHPLSRVVYGKLPTDPIIIEINCLVDSKDQLRRELRNVAQTLKEHQKVLEYDQKLAQAKAKCLLKQQESFVEQCAKEQNAVIEAKRIEIGLCLAQGKTEEQCMPSLRIQSQQPDSRLEQLCWATALSALGSAVPDPKYKTAICEPVRGEKCSFSKDLPKHLSDKKPIVTNRFDVNGQKIGFWKECTDFVCGEGEYRDGKKVGRWKEFCNEYGCNEGEYRDGKRTGRWKDFCNEYGCSEGEYKDDKKNGRWKESCTNRGCAEGEYVNYRRVGRWIVCESDSFGCREIDYY